MAGTVAIQLGLATLAFLTLTGKRGLPWNIRAGAFLQAVATGGALALFIAEGG